MQGDFRAFRDRGNKITAVVGISEGGATRQGLHLVHKLCDASHVFHETGRTFHPKIYFFTGPDDWSVFIGSNNLTAGGVFWNYEAAVEISGSFGSPDDVALAGQFTGLFDELLRDSEVCKPLDDALIKLLIESPVYRIGDEIRMAGRRRSAAARTGAGEPVFGRSRHTKTPDPGKPGKNSTKVSSGAPKDHVGHVDDVNYVNYVDDQPAMPSELLSHSWFKKMSASDAQRPPKAESKTTGNLRLSQAQHPIDQKTYFRKVFFADAQWEAKENARGVQEKAKVPFEVVIGAQSLGVHEIVIDHADYRIAGQGNVPTWLHWGEALTAHLKAHDHTGHYVTIETFEDGSRRLTISADPIGEINVSEGA
ncbi:hypothetical protein GCM10010347_17570 [Streptomyces cirratus]|uniref:Phospholipase D-like domain-containing protein n=1 Tax=Streptomyces cirratus TaxID=68187 RepID=A0ABQ3ESL2_9ACTN|nr:hypothetical protein GCM10010347_17570 [Streptomyces cirratus]